jgi:hypothetical protein
MVLAMTDIKHTFAHMEEFGILTSDGSIPAFRLKTVARAIPRRRRRTCLTSCCSRSTPTLALWFANTQNVRKMNELGYAG